MAKNDVFYSLKARSGGYDVISSQKYAWYGNSDQNIAESHHQRNFCKKLHIKSSFRSEVDAIRSQGQTDRHTDLSINYIGIGIGIGIVSVHYMVCLSDYCYVVTTER